MQLSDASLRNPHGDEHWSHSGSHASCIDEIWLPDDVPIRMLRTCQPPGFYPDPALPEVTLQLVETSGSRATVDFGLGRRDLRSEPGDLILSPANTDCGYDVRADVTLSILTLSAPWLASMLGGAWSGFNGGDFGRLHEGSFRDGAIAHLMEHLKSECRANDRPARLLFESAALTMAGLMLRRSGLAARPDGRWQGRAPTARMQRAVECIEDRLQDDLSLQDIAEAAALSPRSLNRLFHQATGRAPHAYLQFRRVERAKQLLAHSSTPLIEIALACGFASQSHFGQVFKRHVGMTPAVWRRRK